MLTNSTGGRQSTPMIKNFGSTTRRIQHTRGLRSIGNAIMNWPQLTTLKRFAPKLSPSKPYRQLPYNRPASYCPHPLPLVGNVGAPFPERQQNQRCCKDFNWSSCSCKDCKHLHACEKCKGTHHKTPGCLEC